VQYTLPAKPNLLLQNVSGETPEESWTKAAVKSHCFSTWILQALQEAVIFLAESICIHAMKKNSLSYLRECCV